MSLVHARLKGKCKHNNYTHGRSVSAYECVRFNMWLYVEKFKLCVALFEDMWAAVSYLNWLQTKRSCIGLLALAT